MAFVVASSVLHPILRAPQRPAEVIAVLASAVYLRLEPDLRTEPDDQELAPTLVALLARDAVRVPIGMVVALPRQAAPFAGLQPGAPAVIGAGSLRVGGERYQPLRYWDPRVPRLRSGLGNAAAMHRCGAIASLTDH